MADASDGDRARSLATAALDDAFGAIRDGSDPRLFGRIEPLCEFLSDDAGERYDATFAVVAAALGPEPGTGQGSNAGAVTPDGESRWELPASVLDVDCGAGGLLARIADRSERSVGLARDRTIAAVAARHAGVPVVAGDPLDPPVYGEFGAVVGLGYPTAAATGDGDPAHLFDAVYDRTAPGGTAVLDALVEPRGALDDPWSGDVGGYRVDRSVAAGEVRGDRAEVALEYDLTRVESGESVETTADLTLRLFDPGELTEALEAAGFVEISVGDRPDQPGGILAVGRRPE